MNLLESSSARPPRACGEEGEESRGDPWTDYSGTRGARPSRNAMGGRSGAAGARSGRCGWRAAARCGRGKSRRMGQRPGFVGGVFGGLEPLTR